MSRNSGARRCKCRAAHLVSCSTFSRGLFVYRPRRVAPAATADDDDDGAVRCLMIDHLWCSNLMESIQLIPDIAAHVDMRAERAR